MAPRAPDRTACLGEVSKQGGEVFGVGFETWFAQIQMYCSLKLHRAWWRAQHGVLVRFSEREEMKKGDRLATGQNKVDKV